MDKGLLRRIAVICKDYYTLATIDDLFLYGGADDGWWVEPSQSHGSQRMDRFYGWVEGIQTHAPELAEDIVLRVAGEILDNEHLSEANRNALKQMVEAKQPQKNQIVQVIDKADYDFNLDVILSTVARLLAAETLAREVAILTYAKPKLQYVEGDVISGECFYLNLRIPYKLYSQIEPYYDSCQKNIYQKLLRVWNHPDIPIGRVVIGPELVEDAKWRDRAIAWLAGEGINNQGRVRSSNVAPITCDGLQFRSNEEVYLYRALKTLGVSFAPLAVFLRGGEQYKRIEPDFFIIKSGVMVVVEVDGDTVHHESPAEADNRTTMLANEGVHILHVSASECRTPELATACATRILDRVAKLKDARR